MERVERELRLADLRSRERLTATVTDIADETADGEDIVELTYEFSDGDLELEKTDTFPVPKANTDEYEFVRLCRDLHIPLDSAHEKIVETTVPVRWNGLVWEIVVPEPDEREDDDGGRFDDFGLGIAPSFAVGFGIVYPLVAPLIFLHLWPRKGIGRAVATTLVLLGVWILGAYALVTTGIPSSVSKFIYWQ